MLSVEVQLTVFYGYRNSAISDRLSSVIRTGVRWTGGWFWSRWLLNRKPINQNQNTQQSTRTLQGCMMGIGRGSVNVILLITLGCQLLTLPFADGKKQSSVISQLRNFTVFISGLSYGFKLYKVPIVNAVFLQQCFKLLYVY